MCAIPLPWHIQGNCFSYLKKLVLCLFTLDLKLGTLALVYTCFGQAWVVLSSLSIPLYGLVTRSTGRRSGAIFVSRSSCDTTNVSNNAFFQTATKFMVGLSTAIPAASLCINRRLYRIACIRVVTATKADKRRAIMVDLAIGVGLPVLVMILRMFLSCLATIHIS